MRGRSTQEAMRNVAQRYRTSSFIIRLVVLETQAFMSKNYICILTARARYTVDIDTVMTLWKEVTF